MSTMKSNMGSIDRVVRILIAVVIVSLYFAEQVSGIVAIILLLFAGILILTSFMKFCPLYFPFGFTTLKKEK